jgi:tetratricopeptide (TPR) repeat protein
MKFSNFDHKLQNSIQEEFKKHYQVGAEYYRNLMESQNHQERQLGIFFCNLEYENLYNALQICLNNQESISILACLNKYFGLISDNISKLKLLEFVYAKLSGYLPESINDQTNLEKAALIGDLANSYYQIKKYSKAKDLHKEILELSNKINISDSERNLLIALSCYHLGCISNIQELYGDAIEFQLRALDIFSELHDYHKLGSVFYELGLIKYNLKDYQESNRFYSLALDIFEEIKVYDKQAHICQGLGLVAQELGNYEDSIQYQHKALSIYTQFGDHRNKAFCYRHLGVIFQKLGKYNDARENHQIALGIEIELGDEYGQSRTYHDLGQLCQELKDYPEAKQYYQKALALLDNYDESSIKADLYHLLEIVAQEL